MATLDGDAELELGYSFDIFADVLSGVCQRRSAPEPSPLPANPLLGCWQVPSGWSRTCVVVGGCWQLCAACCSTGMRVVGPSWPPLQELAAARSHHPVQPKLLGCCMAAAWLAICACVIEELQLLTGIK